MKRKLIISWSLVVVWMFVIFFLSGTPAKQSTKDSRGIIKTIVEASVETTNYLGITDKHPTESGMTKVVKKIDPIFRKCMHGSVYFVLALLLFNALYQTGIRGKKLYFYAILFSFFYACSDELHQRFVPGRCGELEDIGIDTGGAIVSMIFPYVGSYIKKKRRK